MLIQNEIPKEDLDYILEPLKEDKEENDKQIISEKIIAIVKDSNGKIIDKVEQKMKSLTQYYLALISIPILGTYSGATGTKASQILTSILGLPSELSTSCCSNLFFDMSMQLGSGTKQFSLNLNSLDAPISNGTGTGQLNYGSENVYYNNNSISIVMPVSNKSGNTIQVSEIGIQSYIMIANSTQIKVLKIYYLSYDTLISPISIPNGGSATFQIVITFSG